MKIKAYICAIVKQIEVGATLTIPQKDMMNQIANYLKTIREFIKTGGWCGDDRYYSYICITYTNGDEEFIHQDSIETNEIPPLVAKKIKKIETWWSSGPNCTPQEEVITKNSYWANR